MSRRRPPAAGRRSLSSSPQRILVTGVGRGLGLAIVPVDVTDAGAIRNGWERCASRIALLVLRTNAVAPLMVTQQFWDLLEAGRSPRVVSVSKAALNMLTRSLAAEARRSRIITVVVDPGWVSTDMGGLAAPVTPARSVAGLVRVLDGLTAVPHLGRREAPW